jgi:hypothetical protein
MTAPGFRSVVLFSGLTLLTLAGIARIPSDLISPTGRIEVSEPALTWQSPPADVVGGAAAEPVHFQLRNGGGAPSESTR